jgi:tRNA pseudouridine32 synthase/23S rRNA pseudouridine746 synthase
MGDLPFAVLFQDPRFLVIDKPAGMPVYGAGSVEDFFPLISRRTHGPWLAHRLDRDTAGCLVIALRKAALIEAQALFAAGGVSKVYWAVVRGGPAAAAGVVEIGLSKRVAGRGWRMVEDAGGARSVSDWRVLGRGNGVSWLEVRPRTGRTHQVRVHCAWLGCPIVGDAVYGGDESGGLRLLARGILLPVTPEVRAVAEVPGHMAAALRGCGWV